MIRHSLHLLDQPQKYLVSAAADPHPRVRVEALSAATWLGGPEVAAVLTYVRNSWGNEADEISISDVKAVRAATKDRKLPYVPEILLEEHPFPEE